MVISRFLNVVVFLGTLCGSLSIYTMGGSFRSFAFPKGRLFAAALGGGLGVQSTMQKYRQQQPSYVPEYTEHNHPFNLNGKGLAHSLPKKAAAQLTPVATPAQEIEPTPKNDTPWEDFAEGTALGFGLSYAERTMAQDEAPLSGALQDTATAVVSQGLGYGVDSFFGVPMELGDEIGHMVRYGVTGGKQDNVPETEPKKVESKQSVLKLMATIGLAWGVYQGLKALIKDNTGYTCACPSLGTGKVAKFAQGLIEAVTRSAAKALIAANLVRPALVFAGVESPADNHKKQTVPTPVHA